MNSTPIVVQYLYVHEPEEGFYYPTARAASSAAQVAQRYLECALTQVASLASARLDCELVLATNVTDRSLVGPARRGAARAHRGLGARVVHTPVRAPPARGHRDLRLLALRARRDHDRLGGSRPGAPALADGPRLRLGRPRARCSPRLPPTTRSAASTSTTRPIGTPSVFDVHGRTRNGIGELAREMGADVQTPPWVGGELLTGTVATLARDLVSDLRAAGRTAGRRRQGAADRGADPLARRGARDDPVRRPLSSREAHHDRQAQPGAPRRARRRRSACGTCRPRRGSACAARPGRSCAATRAALRARPGRPRSARARRFNVADAGPLRRLRDDSWIATQRCAASAPGSPGSRALRERSGRADDQHRAGRVMGHLVRHRAEQEALRAGHPLVADDDQVGLLLLGDVEDRVGRVALAGVDA